jgi:hypothetical protein
MDAFAAREEDEANEKPTKKLRSRFGRSLKHRPKKAEEWEEDEEDNYNPAYPRSDKAPDSSARRQEFLAKVAAAAGSTYHVYELAW